jgi:hypothetical protein
MLKINSAQNGSTVFVAINAIFYSRDRAQFARATDVFVRAPSSLPRRFGSEAEQCEVWNALECNTARGLFASVLEGSRRPTVSAQDCVSGPTRSRIPVHAIADAHRYIRGLPMTFAASNDHVLRLEQSSLAERVDE